MYKIHVMISGDVQGVWFRVSAQDKANELELTGWVLLASIMLTDPSEIEK